MCQKENITMKHEVVLHFFWQGSLMMATLTKLLDHSWITWISTQSCRNDYIHSRCVTPERLPTQRFPNYRPIPTVGYSGAICSFWKVHILRILMWWFSNNCRLSACETNPEWKKGDHEIGPFFRIRTEYNNNDWKLNSHQVNVYPWVFDSIEVPTPPMPGFTQERRLF